MKKFHSRELISRLRGVTMLASPGIKPYRDAFISLEKIKTEHLAPAQRYVLVDELKKIRKLKDALYEHSVDIYNIDGYVKLWIEGLESPIDLLPPVVEESIEEDGSVFNIINDGMHRLYTAHLEYIVPRVVFIRGVPKELPYYAYPLRGGWRDVIIVEELLEGFLKKWHRCEDYKKLYRNFNSAFENVGEPRGFSKRN
ncbi:MAG: hypothetical protein D6828_05300 [Nitrospirae bacterium]|nr:MAG: hypothetical protein D6828_05300 [Nitrospirota bacterium]